MKSGEIELAAYIMAACLLASVVYVSYSRPARFIRNPLRRRQLLAVCIGLETIAISAILMSLQSLGWVTLDLGILVWLQPVLLLLGFMAFVVAILIWPQ